jgi:hypothetical protein
VKGAVDKLNDMDKAEYLAAKPKPWWRRLIPFRR